MKWTKEQQMAISTRNKNMLVSAAAGSGKTAVLVERIIRLILDDRVSIDNILVVTFTKAAASEMKEKIIKAIKKEIVSNPKNAKLMRNQLELAANASISTFHSFSLNIIKKYFYIIDVNPKMKIMDEPQGVLMKKAAIDNVFNQFFENKGDDFVEFVKAYGSSKNDDALKDSIVSLYDKIQSIPDPWQWLEKKNKDLFNVESTFVNSKSFEVFIEVVQDKITNAIKITKEIQDYLNSLNLHRHGDNLNASIVELKEMYDYCRQNEFDKVGARMNAFKFPVLRTKGEEKAIYTEEEKTVVNTYKDIVNSSFKDLKKKIFNQPLMNHIEDIKMTIPSVIMLSDLLKAFHEEYRADKADKNLIDFNDIEHYAIEILKDKEVSNEIRNKYEHIFIDEYQDSNFIQEEIINSIKRENNLFMVGDVKQSIYSFRLAEPKIFKEKYNNYKNKLEPNSIVIDLNKNFRSKEAIINSVNYVFEDLIDDYKGQELNPVVSCDDIYNFTPEIHLINTNKEEMDFSLDSDNEEEVQLGAELFDLKATEVEALQVVSEIQDKLGEEYFDHKNNKISKFQYKDMVILLRSVKNRGSVFYNTLLDHGIPVFIDSSEGYFDSLEILSLIDILKIIDNSNDDIALLSALRSPIFSFSIDQLIEIRKENKKGTYAESYEKYLETGNDEEIIKKINDFKTRITKWKKEARFMPIDDFIWKLIYESGIYLSFSALPGGNQRKVNLNAFLDKAKAYRDTGDNTIYGLLEYIGKLKKNVKVGQSVTISENDDVVQITTIHKSKGLEYPIVIIPCLHLKTKYSSINKIGDFNRDMGLGLSYVNSKDKWTKNTLIQYGINYSKRMEEMEEEIRVLYVALTRAKDQLILIGSMQKDFLELVKNDLDKFKTKTLLEMIYRPQKSNAFKYIEKNQNDFTINNKNNESQELDTIVKIEDFNQDVYNFVNRRLSFEYPDKDMLSMKSKFSVSELNNDYAPNVTLKTLDEKEKSIEGVVRGSLYHLVMEKIDFSLALTEGIPYIEKSINQMVSDNIISEEELGQINIAGINDFFHTDIGKRAANNNPVKEQAFTMVHKINDCQVLVQGVMDCFFEENGKLVIIDYKTNKNTENIEKIYIKQLELYKEALMKSTGKEVSQCWLYLFGEGKGVRVI
ncbi:MAG: helicase-exonuclease AddAB subunit AddA [Anaerovoracaceae bacterium]